MDFVDGVDVGSGPEVDVLTDGSANHLISSRRHDFLQSGIDNVEFSGALEQLSAVESFLGQPSGLDNDINQVLLGFFLPLSGHSSWADVVEVLEPLEIADCHTSSIAEDVRQELNSLLEKHILTLKSGGTVGCLNDQLGLESVGIVDVDRLLKGGRDEEIAK
jgi:hypothetical protein